MKKHSAFKLTFALALAVILCVTVMAVSAFAVDVSTAEELSTAVTEAPTDGTETVITVTSDIDVTSKITISGGKNITFTTPSDGDTGFESHTIKGVGLSNAQVVQISGCTVTFKGGIVIDADSVGDGGSSTSRAVYLDSTSTVYIRENAVIKNGKKVNGSSILGGGGVYVDAGTLYIEGGRIIDSEGSYGGGVYCAAGSTLVISGGEISGCSTTSSSGGGICFSSSESKPGEFSMSGGVITGNTSTTYGGGIALNSGYTAVTITGGTVSNNTAGSYAGGAYLYANFTDPITDLTVTGNKAEGQKDEASTLSGGGILLEGGAKTWTLGTGTVISNNTAAKAGGGVAIATGTLTVDGAEITGNEALGTYGGGIAVSSSTSYQSKFTFTSGTVSNNKSKTYGGGIGIKTASKTDTANGKTVYFTLNGGTISGNKSGSSGGGLGITVGYSNPQLAITGGVVSGNTAGSYGGGLSLAGTFSSAITGLTVTGNSAPNSAGGIYFGGSGKSYTLGEGVVISDNKSTGTTYGGGGIYVECSGVTVDGATITGNSAANAGGGIRVKKGVVTVQSGTISENTANVGGAVSVMDNTSADAVLKLYGGTFEGNKGLDGTVCLEAGTNGISVKGNVVTSGEANFIYLSSGKTIVKDGDFSWTGTMGIILADGFTDGDAVITSGDGTVVGEDAAFFTVDIASSFDAALEFDTDHLNVDLTAVAADIRNVTRSTDYKADRLFDALLSADDGDEIKFMTNQTYAWDRQLELTKGLTLTTDTDVAVTFRCPDDASKDFNMIRVRASNKSFTINGNITFDANGATRALYIYTTSSTVNIYDGVVITGASGSGIGNYGTVNMYGGEIHHNGTGGTASGGAIFNYNKFEMSGGSLHDNTGSYGGAIEANYSSGSSYPSTVINGGDIYNNTAANSGGAMYIEKGDLTIGAARIYDNTAAAGAGGAIYFTKAKTAYNDGKITITGATITGNRARGSNGGALYCAVSGTAAIKDSFVNNNVSYGGGGAIFVVGTVNLENTELKGNACGVYYDEEDALNVRSTGYGGSAIYVNKTGRLNLKDVTITGNGNAAQAIYVVTDAEATNAVSFDGVCVIKENSTGVSSYDAVNGKYTVGTDEKENGFYWSPAQSGKTAVRFRETLSADSEIIFTLSSSGIESQMGVVTDSEDALSETDISAALAKFTVPGTEIKLKQQGSNVLIEAPVFTYTLVSVNNAATKEYSGFDQGASVKLPSYSAVTEDFTAGTAYEGKYGLNNFVGYAEVENYGTAPVLKALYYSGQSVDVEALNGKTIYAAWAYAETAPGASVKLPAEEGDLSGIRFVTLLETDILAKIGIKNLTAEEAANGDIGYRIGVTIYKNYGEETAAFQTYYGEGGKTFDEKWFGDDLYDASYDDRGENHAFSMGLTLSQQQYEYKFSAEAFVEIHYTNYNTEKRKAPLPTEGDPAVTVTRTARQVAQAYAGFLASENNDALGETYLGLTEAQMSALEKVSGLTFNVSTKTFA